MMYWKTLAFGVLLVPAITLAQQAEEEEGFEQQQQEMEQQMGEAQQPPGEEEFLTQQEENQIVTDELIGTTVMNQQQEEIGTVQDLLVSEEGEIEGVILGVGGFLGVAQKDVALTWDQIELQRDPQDPESYQVTVDMDRQALEEAPEFVMRGEEEQQQQQ